MTKTYTIKPGQKPSEEQLKEVEEAKKKPIIYDEDCQEISEAMEKAMRSATSQRNRRKRV